MITIMRKGEEVEVWLGSNLPHKSGRQNTQFIFAYDCGDGNTEYAHLLATYLRDRLGVTVRNIRAEAYEQGWKDAKAKKRGKSSQFSVTLRDGLTRGGCW